MKKFEVIGLMSGTSLDGLDMAYVRFFHQDQWHFELMECECIGYDTELVNKLKHANELSGLDLKKLDIYYGKWVGGKAKKFMETRHITPELIVSHGHTVFHQPENGLTLQIGDGYQIMLATGVKTVCDLRSLDVSLEGQGAPLVPIGDKLLFQEYELCLNLGGFSNISFDIKGSRIAFDICPVNTVLNYLASQVNLDYDDRGILAKSGNTNTELLQKLNLIDFYKQNPPKSLGMEWINKFILPLLVLDSTNNLLNTVCHHIAQQIVAAIENNFDLKQMDQVPKMLITGGGAKNTFLIDLLKIHLDKRIEIIIPETQLIDFKEAIVFAFLGLLKTQQKINTLKSVTGAKIDSIGGLIYDRIVMR